MRTCRRCGERKPETAFNGARNRCKACRNQRHPCIEPECHALVSKANARCWSCFLSRPPAERRRPTTPVVYRCQICKQPRDRHNRSGLCLACYRDATTITAPLCEQCGERPRASKRNYCAECWRERTTAREAMSDATMIARNRKGTTGYGIPRRPCHGQCGKKVMWAPSSVNPAPPSTCYACATGKPYTITPVWQRTAA